MISTLKKYIAHLIAVVGVTLVVTGLLGFQPASATINDNAVPMAQVDVLNANAMFVGKSKKVKSCKAYAKKLERPQAPPRDPQALCKGKLSVKLIGKIKTPPCPVGYFGGTVELNVELRQSVKARAFAKSIANGEVETWAEFLIRDSAKIKGIATAQCVKIPVTPPAPPVTPPSIPPVTPPPPPPVTPPTTPPPATPKPSILEVDTINDVLVGNTRTITVRGTVASGHSANLFASAKNGGTITVNKSQTVSGSFTATVTYMAPSEVPTANGNIAAGKDRVDFTLTQDDGQTASGKTNDFVITPRPVTPA